jgi:hypothetical protein
MTMDFIEFVPPGRSKGLLLRPPLEKPGDICPLYAEHHVVYPVEEWDSLLPGHTGLDQYVWIWLDQDGVGSCGADSEHNGEMLLEAAAGQPRVAKNPLGMYHTTSGGRDNGSNLGDNLQFGRDVGHFPEEVWPRSKGWKAAPTAEAVAAANRYRIDEFSEVTGTADAGSTMFDGFPLYWGSAGHAKCGIRVLDKTWFKYLNSWGKGWSDPMAGRWLAEQRWPGRDEEWWMHVGLVAATLHSTPEGRTQWEADVRVRWRRAYGTLAATGELTLAEQIHATLQTDEWSGRGVEKFSRINYGYGAYCQRTTMEPA